MRSIIAGILILFFGWLTQGYSQTAVSSDSIEYYAYELVRNHDFDIREKAFHYLNENLGSYLDGYADFQDSFPRFEGLAVLENMTLNLRIVTYQLYRDTSTYEYGGWVQSDRLDTSVFLTDASARWSDDHDVDYMNLDPRNWYGALYYQLHPLAESKDEMTILLFGLDNYHFFTKRKILETLVIKKGRVGFGKSVIEMEPGLPVEFWKKRFILDYSVQAPATLRYDSERKKIIFDHLIFMPSDIPEQKIMRVPDGTYSGFDIDEKEQKLVFVEKVFDEVMDEAPGGGKKSKEKRDLFGDPQK